MKFCPECKTEKTLGLFSKNSSRYDGLQGQCKECRSARRKSDYLINKDRELSLANSWAKENPDAIKSKSKRHRESEHGHVYYNSKSAHRRATKCNATPVWLTDEQKQDMTCMYALAKKFEKLCNTIYHVDHIVPLAGKDICGLHVPWNLQLLPASVNIAKSNKHHGKESLGGRSQVYLGRCW